VRASHTNIGGASASTTAPHDPISSNYGQHGEHPRTFRPQRGRDLATTGRPNHQYDLSNFYQSLTDGNLPAVSLVKAPRYQDGHAGYSDPIDEQTYLVNTINAIEHSKFWKSTAIIITYDDSDGWYDQVMPPSSTRRPPSRTRSTARACAAMALRWADTRIAAGTDSACHCS